MIERAIEIKSLLNHLVTNLPILTNNWPTSEEWSTLNDLLDLLAPFALTTKVISASSYPTIGEVKWYFLGIKNHLERSRDSNYSLQSQVDEMKRVFDNYFDQINQSLHVPAFFDPRYKIQLMEGCHEKIYFSQFELQWIIIKILLHLLLKRIQYKI